MKMILEVRHNYFTGKDATRAQTVDAIRDVLEHTPNREENNLTLETDIASAARLVQAWDDKVNLNSGIKLNNKTQWHLPLNEHQKHMQELIDFMIKTRDEYQEVLALAFLGATDLKPEEAECVMKIQTSLEGREEWVIYYRKRGGQ